VRFEAEDAGGGCVLGPEVVVVRAEDGRSHVGLIPARAAREREAHAAAIVRAGLRALGATRDDAVLLCQGNLFDRAARELADDGFRVERGPVSAEAHNLAEGEHQAALRRLLGYLPPMRDRGYAALNFRLMAEVRRRPWLWRHWKASVRVPASLQAAHAAFWARAGGEADPPPAGRRRRPRRPPAGGDADGTLPQDGSRA
jgi:hypothetical protein